MDQPTPGIDFLLDRDDLQHPDSLKWTQFAKDVLPLWVADMDFSPPPSIRRALVNRLERGIGYEPGPPACPRLTPLLRAKLEAQGFEDLPAEKWISYLPGVVPGLYLAVLALTEVGQHVMTMTPIYRPFFSAITDHGRNVRGAPLTHGRDGWAIDWDAMEAAVTSATKLLLLCHPHNPTGRVWTHQELSQLAEFAQKHCLFVASDELHADLTLDGPFIPFAAVAPPELRQRLITLTGPCKTYNTAGLGIGAMVSHNPELITRLKKASAGIIANPNAMSVAMWTAAVQDDGRWLASVKDYLRGNRQLLTDFVREQLPMVRYTPPQATYLAWLDFRGHSRGEHVAKFLLKNAKVALADGHFFGKEYTGFARLNFATSREPLSEAMDRIVRALST